jgi:tRNA(fMet)-specific endonuclease VapC
VIVLDTDHLVEWLKGSSAKSRDLHARLASTTEDVAITIVSVEEVLRGWLAEIRRFPNVRDQIRAYDRFHFAVLSFHDWRVLPWNEPAVAQFDSLRAQRIRLGSMDLKIGSIALAVQATLLTRNAVDFSRIPNLKFEDWLS